jgi:flagellar basal body-associated protein FliL
MKGTGNEDRSSSTMPARMGVGSWIILIVLLLLLVATGFVIYLGWTLGNGYLGWTLGNGADVPTSGYAAMAFGVIISLAFGFGLMALVFYGSRKGYDEPPALIVTENDSTESKDVSEPDRVTSAERPRE